MAGPGGKFKKGGHGSAPTGHTPEVIIIGLVIIGIAIFILFPGLFAGQPNSLAGSSAGFLKRLGQTLLLVWEYRLGPVIIFLDVVLFGILVFSMFKFWKFRTPISIFETPTIATGKKTRKKDPRILHHWTAIVKRVNTGTVENMRLAVLEADALVDFYLKANGYEGETMADRLNDILAEEVPSLERVWKAHKLRNELAHTPGFPITPAQAKEALIAFRDFLKQLDAF